MASNPHKSATRLNDKIAYALVKFFRFFADTFFQKRYGNRAIVLETVAAVPGMVGAGLLHLRCLRKIKNDEGWIKKLLDEADNERMHLMTFITIAKPSLFERFIIFFAQMLFVMIYLTLYIISSKTAHRFVGYLEEEAVISYDHYLDEIESGRIKNVAAPEIAKQYWHLKPNATLRDVVIAVRKDEEDHRDVNHYLADRLTQGDKILKSVMMFNEKSTHAVKSKN